ncbi:MAG: hypothetical protein K1X75_01875 [Leptospirales bacterium]|nr:hypothetical protein [Leptospirales bacterium]
MIEFLAQTARNDALLTAWLLVFVRFMLMALFLHFALQAIQRFPGLSRFSGKWWFDLGMHLLNLALAVFLTFSLPPLRLFDALQLLPARSTMLWPDILFSALALSQIGRLWVFLIRYLDRRSSS